ncbi:STAS domain-containing protein [bacterium AH-315-F18]|nr:STAS domain-containing protein [bacterium AH-315-F18]
MISTEERTDLSTESQMMISYRNEFGIQDIDLSRIRTFGEFILPKLDQYIEYFYEWQKDLPVYTEFFSDPVLLKRVQGQQKKFWESFFEGKFDDDFVRSRADLGRLHGKIGLPLNSYMSGAYQSLRIFIDDLYDGNLPDQELKLTVASLTKVLWADAAIVSQVYADMVRAREAAQSKAIVDMATPVTSIWEGILMLPMVGIIDSQRAQSMMNVILTKIADSNARAFILDISGVAVVDTAVANHLIKITRATKLMGCESTISGVSPAIAQTIVELGIDVKNINTTANLRDALRNILVNMGIERIDGTA